MRTAAFLLVLVAGLIATGGAAFAEPARCFTTDDGEYDCDFVQTAQDGSFEIAADGKPSFSLVIEEPGLALGFGDYGDGNVAHPGRYLRSESDPACWVNDATENTICAW